MLKFSQDNLPELDFKKAVKKPIPIKCVQIDDDFEVETMEGLMKGKKGDWLMIGITGEVYACDREIFEKTYIVKE
ncbi:PGDYG domain-containing protein [Aequorivita echinoideorum]|uniref:PGDYG domain-containing protein n=1 Tax=Aequorivita echinoideorum TaxID=1549647 RepID=A0ABS5S6P3_9FLAO|nr:PGDYG domain-containing protein [Aequorivita echinoideorum]MBT0608673.1 PGDYG domain-containing protein [Aequorivita echinoideorum]